MIKAAIVGYGNIGKAVLEAVSQAKDFELCGIVRRSALNPPPALEGLEVVDDIQKLKEKPDVAILCVPTRSVEAIAKDYLSLGISTVDSFDIHSKIPALHQSLEAAAKEHGRVAVMSAGWDPGTDSVIRAILLACAPKGLTYTTFGPGMSMGHTVAIKAIEGVRDALSVTVPVGSGMHRRMCYVELEDGYDPEHIKRRIKEDDYFKKDETHVKFVRSVDDIRDSGHGVLLERKGVSGVTPNQRFEFRMSINNPALTAQVMVSSARAAVRQQPGCYTLIEIPPVDLLPGEREEHIKHLV